MLILFETPAGFALFRLNDPSKLKDPEDLHSYFNNVANAKKLVSLADFQKFVDTTEALSSTTALIEGKMDNTLEGFLRKCIVDERIREPLGVADKRLGQSIKETFPSIECVSEPSVLELFRCIRFQLQDLLSTDGDIQAEDLQSMSLGLAHSLGRYKLKFSPDKVDVMIIQAISLLDDLNKEINTYAMRVKEWYGWHFPELVRVLQDSPNASLLYARVVKHLGLRSSVENVDLTDVVDEELAEKINASAKLSMGTEVSEEDVGHIQELCTQVLEIASYRDDLEEYIKNRMQVIAPNLSVMVGEILGAKLIAHAGSLMNLAKHPSSTIQILGAEKALFRALKTKKKTPKYGIIFQASLVNQASSKSKGKISRVLANKTSLSIRVDALGDNETEHASIAIQHLQAVNQRLQQLDGAKSSIPTPGVQFKKYQKPGNARTYETNADETLSTRKRKRDGEDEMEWEEASPSKKKKF